MDIKVERVYWNDNPEWEDVTRTKYITVDLIVSLEECFNMPDRTEIQLATGETLTVNESLESVNNKIKQFYEEERERERRDSLGI